MDLVLPLSKGLNYIAQMVKKGDLGSTPVSGRSSEEGNGSSLRYSFLEKPMDREAWQAMVHGVTKSQTQLSG